MQFLKSLLRGSSSLIFKLSLVLLVIVGSTVMVFGTSGQIKQSLKASKIYDNLVTNIVENAAKDSEGQGEESPFSQPAVQEAAKKAISPAFLQNTSEQIIDGMYSWLQSKTPQPEFNIDVSGVKQQFTSAVGDYVVARAKQLPVCTPQQAKQLAIDKIDPLTVGCIPTGFDIESLRAQVASELDKQQSQSGENKDNLLQQSVISPDSLPKDEEGKTPVQNLTEKVEKAPKIYRIAVITPWIIGALAVVSGGLVILLYDEKRRGIRNLAITVLAIGALTLVGIFLSNFGFNKLEKSNSVVGIDPNIKEPVIALVRSISSAYNNRLLMFGILYTALGAGTLIALRLTRPKKNEPEHSANESKEEVPGKPDNPSSDSSSVASVKMEVSDKSEDKSQKPNKTLIQ